MANDKYQKSLLAQGIITKDITNLTNVKDIPINKIKINPNQPRKTFDPGKMQELTESIKSAGVIGPLVVRPQGENYEIVAGERRYRAAMNAGIEKVPCIVRDLNDTEAYELSLVENIQRDDLDPIEEAMAYKHLMDVYGYTYREFKQAIGKSQGYINERIQLLNLPDKIKADAFALRTRTRHARHILKLKDNVELQEQVFQKTVNENLSHEETAALVEMLNDKSIPDSAKSFILESKELKPDQAHSIIVSELPDKSILKVLKAVAKKAAVAPADITPAKIDQLVEREKSKVSAPSKDIEDNTEVKIKDILASMRNLVSNLKDDSSFQGDESLPDSFQSKRKILVKELEEFISIFKER